MKQRAIILTILFLGTLTFLSAQDLTLDYVEGYLDLKEGSDWVELYIGDNIPRSATVRLDEDSLAELSGGNMNFILTRPGVYVIQDLLSSRRTMDSTGIGSLVSDKVSSLFSERATGPDTVGGVRAAEVETEPAIDWMTSEAADMISQARDMIEDGEYDDAMDVLDEAYDFAADEYEEQEIFFYRGYIYTVKGSLGKALSEFSKIYPENDQPYYSDLFLLKGKLLVDSFAFDEAVEWFDRYDPGYASDDSTRQSIYLLHGLAAKETGLAAKANTMLKMAVDIDPSTETASVASDLLSR